MNETDRQQEEKRILEIPLRRSRRPLVARPDGDVVSGVDGSARRGTMDSGRTVELSP